MSNRFCSPSDAQASPSLTKRAGAVAIAALAAFLVAFSGESFAQGFDLSQLLGGGSKHQRGNSGQSSGGSITVQRGAPPFEGKFVGTQKDQGAETTITAEFACYPASDSALPQTRTFVCYSAGSKANSPSGTDNPSGANSPSGANVP